MGFQNILIQLNKLFNYVYLYSFWKLIVYQSSNFYPKQKLFISVYNSFSACVYKFFIDKVKEEFRFHFIIKNIWHLLWKRIITTFITISVSKGLVCLNELGLNIQEQQNLKLVGFGNEIHCYSFPYAVYESFSFPSHSKMINSLGL